MSKKIKVRLAGPRDVVNVGKLMEQGASEVMSRHVPVNDVRMYQWALDTIKHGIVAVAELSGRLIGIAGAGPFRPNYSDQWMLDVETFFVVEKFRKFGIEKMLLRAIEGWADQKGVPIIMSLYTKTRTEAKERMMSMQGYEYIGGQFVRFNDGKAKERDNEDQDRDSSVA